ncbi:hypothetical protein P5V15_009341 [Pogonomyrmex californicus]
MLNTVKKTPRRIGERRKRVREQLRTDYLNIEEKKTLKCDDYCDIFYLEGDLLLHTTAVQHGITTRADSTPIRPYHLPEKYKIKVNKQIKKMLKEKIIRSSTSGTRQYWSSRRRPMRPEYLNYALS